MKMDLAQNGDADNFLINIPDLDLSSSPSDKQTDSEAEPSSISTHKDLITIDRNYKTHLHKNNNINNNNNDSNFINDPTISMDTDCKSDYDLDLTDDSIGFKLKSDQNQIKSVKLNKQLKLLQSQLPDKPNHRHHHTKEFLLSVASRPISLRALSVNYNNHISNNIGRMNGNYQSRPHSQLNGLKQSLPFDYWTIPHNYPTTLKPKHVVNARYYIPPIMFSQEKGHIHTKRKAMKNVREKADILISARQPTPYHSHRHHQHHHQRHHPHRGHAKQFDVNESKENDEDDEDDDDDDNTEEQEQNESNNNDLKVYFRFSPGNLADPFTLDFMKNDELLVRFQAKCRAWLARKEFAQRKKEYNAVLCIQKNANVWFCPWLRLMIALKPLIKRNLVEEELLFYKSEVERYKAMVRMLRFENAEQQARVANLLHLLEQMNTAGSNSPTVQSLIQQISDALNKNQEYWKSMASENIVLQTPVSKTLQEHLDTEVTSRPQEQSPVSKLKRDAQFYRDQVELLREEVDEQQLRSNEHYRNQVRVLSERVEQLQHFLALESSKVERLNVELDEQHESELEAKGYARNLEFIVNQLSRQLDQRQNKHQMGDSEDFHNNSDSMNKSDDTVQDEKKDVFATYHNLLYKLQDYCNAHPELQDKLNLTPFKQQLTIQPLQLSNHINDTNHHLMIEPQQRQQQFTATANASSREDMDDLTPRGNLTHELIELKRQLTTVQHQLIETGEHLKIESENREELENENFSLHDRISILDRQLRHTQDEYDEMVRKQLFQQRAYKELQDQLEEEVQKYNQIVLTNRGLEQQLTDLREFTEPEDDLMTKEWESMKSKLKADLLFYKHSLEQLQEEYEHYRIKNDPITIQALLQEKEEKLNVMEKEKQQWRLEMDIQNVKLQNTTSLLEDAELRLKMFNRERTKQMHRMSQLEAERDEAIREAATVNGRASADRELSVAKVREMEELRIERDMLRRELNEVKQNLAGSLAENTAERRQLQARLREIELHNEVRITDFKTEIERMREQIEQLQLELQATQTAEAELRSTNQHQKWKIDELEDQISHYTRRISGLERKSVDLDAELLRAKADLTATRETVILRRSGKSRMSEEWQDSVILTSETEDSDMEDTKKRKSNKCNENGSNRSLVQGSKESIRTLKNRSAMELRSNHKKYQSIPDLSESSYHSRTASQSSIPKASKRNAKYRNSLHELTISDLSINNDDEDSPTEN